MQGPLHPPPPPLGPAGTCSKCVSRAVRSDVTMFGHGGESQMGTQGRFPGNRDAGSPSFLLDGAQAAAFWLFFGGWGLGQGREKVPAC